jgi:pimeloyl-ACP methyl ester carboxylesterase/DNA-binding winged helix-turn-helix (wHTH) protein
MSNLASQIYTFRGFRLDVDNRLLFAGDQIVTLTPKAFDTLLVLVENRSTVLTKTDLMSIVWEGQFVEENNLAQNIHVIRKALGEGIDGVRYIETVPKHGYRFIADVEVWDAADLNHHLGKEDESDFTFRPTSSATRTEYIRGEGSCVLPKVKTQYATSTGDINIAYQVVGEGPLDLVFVMGWVSHLEAFWQEPSFARFLMRLASFSRLILFDKRGTGLSDPVPLSDLPTLEQRMTDVQAVMDAAGSKRAALLGISEGGPLCSLFAAAHPERTLALVMIGTYATRQWSEDYPWAPTKEERAIFLEEVKKNWGGPVGIKERAPAVADDPQFRQWWSAYLRLGASPGAALALTQMNAEIDVRNVLPLVGVPTLVIHRSDDACLPVEGGRFVASRIPGAKYVELEGADHLPFVGDQDAILNEVEEFLKGVQPEVRVDRILTTILFIDFRQEAKEPRRTHIRQEVARFKGKEIDMTDNHLLATFDGPARAIRCACAIVDAATHSGLQVRAGLHTGECDITGEKISGVAVKLGEAIAMCAAFGEVLISHTVKELVAGSGIAFESSERQHIENLTGDWRLSAVRREAVASAR